MSIDRERISEPISAEEPSGEWLRREGTYAAVQEAVRSDPGDPSYGIPEKRPDWEEAAKLCADALGSRTKDFYLSNCLLESLTHTRGATGLADGLWTVAEIHERFWGDFHPRPRDEGANLDARLNQLDVFIQSFPRVLDALPMNEGREVLTRLDWRYAGGKLPGGDPSPIGADQKDSAVRESSWDFYDQAVRSLQAAQTELGRFDDLLDDRYGRDAPSLADTKEALDEVKGLFEGLLRDKGPSPYEERARGMLQQTGCDFLELAWTAERVREGIPTSRLLNSIQAAVVDRAAGIAPEEGWAEFLQKFWRDDETYKQQTEFAPPPPAPEPTAAPMEQTGPAPVGAAPMAAAPVAVAAISGSPLAAILGGCQALRRSEPGNPLSYVITRHVCWADLDALDEGSPVPAPPAGLREQCDSLFQQQKWPELLELCESSLEQKTCAGWLDLQRYCAASMNQIGMPYGPVRRRLLEAIGQLVGRHRWLLEATLSDGRPAADEITRNWIDLEASPTTGGAAEPGTGASPDPGAGERLGKAREILADEGLEAAVQLLQREAATAECARDRACSLRDLGQLCLEAERGDYAIPVFERLCDELRRAAVEAWEGPDFLAGALEGLYRSYTLVSDRSDSQSERMRVIADELAKVDLGRRLRLDASNL